MSKGPISSSIFTENLRKRFFSPALLIDQTFEWEMNRILSKLEKQTKKVNFKILLNILRRAKINDKRQENRHKTFSKVRGSEWDKMRNKVLKNFDDLVDSLLALYQVTDDHSDLRRLIDREIQNNKYLLKDDGVLKNLEKLHRAINSSPLLQLSRPRGHQSQPWLKEALDDFKKANVPKADGEQLLCLIGLKPYSID